MSGDVKPESLYVSCLKNGQQCRALPDSYCFFDCVASTSHPCYLEQVEERLGPASESLEALLAEGHAGSFDLAFIGALATASVSGRSIAPVTR